MLGRRETPRFIGDSRQQRIRLGSIYLILAAAVALASLRMDWESMLPAGLIAVASYQSWALFAGGPRRRPGLLLDHRGVVVHGGRGSPHLVEWGAIADVTVVERRRHREIRLEGCTRSLPVPYDSRWLPDPDFDAKVAEVRTDWIRFRPSAVEPG